MPVLPDLCPACGADAVRPLLYGFPTVEAHELAKRGEIKLGGCELWPGCPAWACLSCDIAGGVLWEEDDSET
jgi:hypothetical protein